MCSTARLAFRAAAVVSGVAFVLERVESCFVQAPFARRYRVAGNVCFGWKADIGFWG